MQENEQKAERPTDIDRSQVARLLEIDKQISALEAEQFKTAESLGLSALACPVDKIEAFIEEVSELGFSNGGFVNDIIHRIYELRLQAERESQAEAVSAVINGEHHENTVQV